MKNNNDRAPIAENTRGILLVIAALSLAAFSGAIMKLLGEQISAFQVTWFRFAGMSLMLLPYLVYRYGVAGLRPARPLVQLIRGLTMAGGTTAFVLGVKTVDYADAIAILYAYPFVLVILAVLFLGERAGGPVWTGVGAGFVGVLLVMRPEFNDFNSGNLYIFACAFIVGVQLTLNRKLSIVSPPLVTAFAGAVCAALALTFVLPGAWTPIPAGAWWQILLLVLCGGANQTMLVFAFAHTDASTLAPFTYSEIVSAVVFGFLFFGTLPTALSWAGIALITLSGIYVARALHVQNIPRRVPKV
ncbi:MAG: DMT family transporter [Gammaproteobacteria bacterium]|jgi:drug/metabolite transporter (DMT)-like permease